jgi:hypothetical protein
MVAVLRPEEIYVIHSNPKDNYSKVRHDLQDSNDFLKKGELRDFLNDMMRRPPGWKFRVTQLAKSRGCCKRTIQRKMRELENLGYVKRFQLRASKSGFGQMVYYVSDQPIFKHSQPIFTPKLVNKVVENLPETLGHTTKHQNTPFVPEVVEKVPESVAISQVCTPVHSDTVSDSFVHAPACHTYEDLGVSKTKVNTIQEIPSLSESKTIVNKEGDKIPPARACWVAMRQTLDNQITVSKQTPYTRRSAPSGIFKRKIPGQPGSRATEESLE